MRIERPLLRGRFLRRYKRFFADVEVDGEVVVAHCPNTGSLSGCLVEGAEAWLRDSGDPKRKLRHTWQAIRVGDAWVNVDTGLPNASVAAAVEAGRIPELAGYARLRREVRYGTNSRADLLLEDDGRPPCWVEVKNTTLARGTVALFPDAVTARGLKHLGELTARVEAGERAVQFFFVSRADVEIFRPADDVDPAYGEGLRAAAAAGVELVAYTAAVEPERLEPLRALPIELDAQRAVVPAAAARRRAPRRR